MFIGTDAKLRPVAEKEDGLVYRGARVVRGPVDPGAAVQGRSRRRRRTRLARRRKVPVDEQRLQTNSEAAAAVRGREEPQSHRGDQQHRTDESRLFAVMLP